MIRGRLCLQLTDKVLLPATISYTDDEQQRSICWGLDDALQPSNLYPSEPTVETADGDVEYTDADDGSDGDSKVDEADSITCSADVAVNNTALHPGTVTGSVETDEPSSKSCQADLYPTDRVEADKLSSIPSQATVYPTEEANKPSFIPVQGSLHLTGSTEADKPSCESSQACLHPNVSVQMKELSSESIQDCLRPADSAGRQSVMTVSVINFPSEADACDTVHLIPASRLPSAVHIGDPLLHSSDADAIVTESTAAAAASNLSVVSLPSAANACDTVHSSAASLLPSTVPIGDTLLHSAAANAVIATESAAAAAASGTQLASCTDKDLMNSEITDHDDSSRLQHPDEWTRSVFSHQFFSSLHSLQQIPVCLLFLVCVFCTGYSVC